jgi:uncharacterized protein (TIGR02246 family)
MNSDEQAIRDLVDTWMRATKAGDLATVLDLMTEDMIFMVPGQKPFGKREFAAGSKAMSGFQVEGTARIEEIQLLGDWAYIRNYIDVTITPPGQQSIRNTGYTLSILRKEPDGRWRLCRDANLVMQSK